MMDFSEAETDLLSYWCQMPAWKASDAIYILAVRRNPDDRSMDDWYGMPHEALSCIGLARHFELFGLIDSFETNSFYVNAKGDKRPPSEWVSCYMQYPDRAALPEFVYQTIEQNRANFFEVSESSMALAAMNRASFEFWSTADRDDPTTHPDNADVAAWLVNNGNLSRTAANNAASLIRPEWACTGRKPSKGQ